MVMWMSEVDLVLWSIDLCRVFLLMVLLVFCC